MIPLFEEIDKELRAEGLLLLLEDLTSNSADDPALSDSGGE